MAISKLVLGHIIFPLFVCANYCYFVIMLCEILSLQITLLVIFGILLLLYLIATKKLLISNPGFTVKQNIQQQRTQVLKRNQRNRQDLLQLMQKNITYQQLWELQKQYLHLYSTSSFCSICDTIKPPRAYHCQLCKRCVHRRQKHSQLLGTCVGQANMKIFMQYLCIAMIFSAFCIGSVLFITISQHPKLEDFTNLQLIIFAVILMALGTCLILFIKQFSISYYNSTENITQTQRKMKIITNKNNPFLRQNYHGMLFKSKFDYFDLRNSAAQGQWVDLQNHQNHQ